MTCVLSYVTINRFNSWEADPLSRFIVSSLDSLFIVSVAFLLCGWIVPPSGKIGRRGNYFDFIILIIG